MNGEDVRRLCIEAAKIADQVNADIREDIAPSSNCDCDDAAATSEYHACEGCAMITLCKNRSTDSLARFVCTTCKARDVPNQHTNRRGGTLTEELARSSVSRSFSSECRTHGLEPKSSELQEALTLVIEDVFAQLLPGATTRYRDSYTGFIHYISQELGLIGNNPSRTRFIPQRLSVDATLPIGDPAHHSLKHAPGNLVITSCAVNFAKYTNLPDAPHCVAASRYPFIYLLGIPC